MSDNINLNELPTNDLLNLIKIKQKEIDEMNAVLATRNSSKVDDPAPLAEFEAVPDDTPIRKNRSRFDGVVTPSGDVIPLSEIPIEPPYFSEKEAETIIDNSECFERFTGNGRKVIRVERSKKAKAFTKAFSTAKVPAISDKVRLKDFVADMAKASNISQNAIRKIIMVHRGALCVGKSPIYIKSRSECEKFLIELLSECEQVRKNTYTHSSIPFNFRYISEV